MVRRLNTDGWKALPLVALAAGALVWHVLACVESPMAFSPTGDLAFTVMEPYGGGEDLLLCGTHTYRLMLLPAGAEQPKVLEESSHWMISGPAFSADGQRLAYFRIPLLTAEGAAAAEQAFQSTQKSLPVPTSRPSKSDGGVVISEGPGVADWPIAPELKMLLEAGVPAAPAMATVVEMGLPSLEGLSASYTVAAAAPRIPAQLVERSTADGQVASITWVILPLAAEGDMNKDGISRRLLQAYVLGKPLYSPDGQCVYFCPGGVENGSMVLAVNAASRTQRLLAPGALAAALSPDGKTIATLQKGCLGFVRTDGSVASYVRCETSVSPAGMVWADKDTLAILRSDKIADKPVRTLSFVKADGTISKTVTLPEMDVGDEGDAGQLALSPDGRYLVVTGQKAAYFLDSGGTLLGTWSGGEKEVLAQATFRPDGKQVAFKFLQGRGDAAWVVAIVFFSPAGQELRRVSVPLLHPLPTQPAQTQPAPTQPAQTQPASAPAPVEAPVLTPRLVLEIPPPVESPSPLAEPSAAPATKPAPASAPAVELNPDQKKALEELTPELP